MFKTLQITSILSLFVILFTASACLDLEPETATNPVGTDHTVTTTFFIDDGEVGEGLFVTFKVISGPNAGKESIPNSGECTPNDDCTTDANGQVSWTYSSVIPGTDIIVATATVNVPDEGTFPLESDQVEKIWVIPSNVPTLSEWGLISMAAILGIVGFMVIRRNKATT
jgi:hypothetical protein